MKYQSIDNEVLERHLYADPTNSVLVAEAARRFIQVSAMAARVDEAELSCTEATSALEEANAELQTVRAELDLADDSAKDANEELDEVNGQLRAAEIENDRLAAELGAAKARIAHLEEVLGLVANV